MVAQIHFLTDVAILPWMKRKSAALVTEWICATSVVFAEVTSPGPRLRIIPVSGALDKSVFPFMHKTRPSLVSSGNMVFGNTRQDGYNAYPEGRLVPVIGSAQLAIQSVIFSSSLSLSASVPMPDRYENQSTEQPEVFPGQMEWL